MKERISPWVPALSGLALRLGLGWVLFAWGYDLYFNPHYYVKWFGGFTTVVMVVHLVLGAFLVTGFATRIAAPAAAVLFATLGVGLAGHQPIGLPQNAGLAAGAIALWLLGPGELVPWAPPALLPPALLARANAALRAGLALTFLIYGVQKFTNDLEYQIVVSEVPLLRPLVDTLGARAIVGFLGVFEILTGILLVAPPLVMWAAMLQAAALGAFLVILGYPFSYPQDVGLLAAVVALVLTQAVVRGLPDRSWLNCLFGSHDIPPKGSRSARGWDRQPQRQGRR